MTTVIGIDPSFTCTGFAVWTHGNVLTGSVRTKPALPRVYRERQVVDSVMQWVNPDDNLLVMLEAVYQGKYGRTSLDLAGLHDVLVYEAIRRGATVGVVPAKTAKMFATNNGAASKQDMVEQARVRLGVDVANHNEADAVWFAVMGAVALDNHTLTGWPPRLQPDAVATHLDKVTWIPSRPTETLKDM